MDVNSGDGGREYACASGTEGNIIGSEDDERFRAARASVEAGESYMRREKQRCTSSTIKDADLLGHKGACVRDAW